MATTFEVIYLGSLPLIDTTQGNEVVENAAGILGSYGTQNAPLSGQVRTLSPERLSEDDNDSYDLDNGGGYDSFRINGGAPQGFDAVATYNATITYADGTTATITAVVFQDVNGNTYLAPEETANADQAALTAKPIQSLTLTSVAANSGDMVADRVAGDFLSSVDGTAGNDTMPVGYTDAQGDQIGSGNDFIVAGDGNDSVSAGGGADTVFGGTGADTITAGEGNDSVEGGDGNDSLGSWGSDDGNDTFRGGAGDDTIYGGLGSDQIFGDAGNDLLSGSSGADTIFGGDGNDFAAVAEDHDTDVYDLGERAGDWDAIWFGNFQSTTGVNVTFTGTDAGSYAYEAGGATGSFIGAEQVGGTTYADTINASTDTDGGQIFGNGGADSIIGGSGNDQIWGGSGNDTISGGAGNDTLYGEAGNDTLSGGEGNDTVFAGNDADSVDGGNGADSLFGEAGNDSLDGGAGADYISGGAGNDSMLGGDDADTFNLVDGFGVDTVIGGEGGIDGDTLQSSGVTTNVTVTFTGAESGTLTDGSNSVTFSQIETVTLGAGSDTVYGGAGNEMVIAGDGNDSLFGGDGNDTLFGGDGNDVVAGLGADDSLFGGAGSDTAVFSGTVTDYSFDHDPSGALIVTDSVVGRDGADTITGFEYVEFNGVTYHLVAGDDGSNTTLQGPGDGTPSIIIAHDGNDWGGGHATSDVIFGGAGDDTLDGGDGDDTLVGEGDNDLLRGDGGKDSLVGGSGADTLQGGLGDDTLEGGADSDLLTGGDGTDSLTGGDGDDIFVLTRAGGTDTVSDFDMTFDAGRTADQLDVSDLRTPAGDLISWRDVVVTDTVGDGSGDAVLTFPGGETVILQGVSPDQVNSKQAMASVGIPCFTAGTRILTPTGWTLVETLRAGSVVLTAKGPLPVIWAGHRKLDPDDFLLRPDWRPVHFPIGAICNIAPLRLSPQHAVLVTDASGAKALVRAKHLAECGFGGARVAKTTGSVTYHHVLLPRHAILCAEGAATESFYPGPAAMEMLGWPARLAVTAAIVAARGRMTHGDALTLADQYGARVYPLIGKRSLAGCSAVSFASLDHAEAQ